MYGRLHPMFNRTFGIIASLDIDNAVHNGPPLFIDPSFGNLIRTVQPVIPTICYEFFATFEMVKSSRDFAADDFLTFRLGGERRSCSLFEFGRGLRLYT